MLAVLRGITFAHVQGKNITKLFYYKGGFKRMIDIMLLPIAMRKHRAIEPSMLQGIRNGKPSEVDAINGVICSYGRRLGIPTPINDKIVEIIKKEEMGTLPMKAENIRLLDSLQ